MTFPYLWNDWLLEEYCVDEVEAGDASSEQVGLEAVGEGDGEQLLNELVQLTEGLKEF